MINRFLTYIIFLFFGSSCLMDMANAQIFGKSYDFIKGADPISISLGVKYQYHYNFEINSILTPPKIIFVGAQIGYILDGMIMPYVEFNASISSVSARSGFAGVKAILFKKRFSKYSKVLFRAWSLSLNADYGLSILEPPTSPQVYIPQEWLLRFGGSGMIYFGKGKSFLEFTGLIFNQSNSNLMTSVSMNFGFLIY